MKNKIFEQSFSQNGGGKSFLLKSLFFSFLMLGFFSCGKEVVTEIVPVGNTDGYVTNRTNVDCECFSVITEISGVPGNHLWALSEVPGSSVFIEGIDNRWIKNSEIFNPPSDPFPTPSSQNFFTLTLSRDVSDYIGATFHITTTCTYEDGDEEPIGIVTVIYQNEFVITEDSCEGSSCTFEVDIDCSNEESSS